MYTLFYKHNYHCSVLIFFPNIHHLLCLFLTFVRVPDPPIALWPWACCLQHLCLIYNNSICLMELFVLDK